MKTTFFSLCFSLFLFSVSVAQSYNGTYQLITDEATLTLVLQEVSGGIITGTLSSTKGVAYQVQGEISDGVAMGVCSDQQSGLYFEAYLEESELSMGLIEPDEFNMPDYNTARYFVFEKQDQDAQVETPNVQPQAEQARTLVQPQSPEVQSRQNQSQTNTSSSPDISTKEAGDPIWGWKFRPPGGWQFQKNQEGIFLGHNTIAGLIMVLPHMSANMQEMQQEMIKGISEEGNYLSLSGNLTSPGDGMLEGEYSGVMDGAQVKARGIGTLSPYGGGAFIIAVTTPDKYGNEIQNTAGAIAQSLTYFKPVGGELMPHFAGKWTNYTKNTSTWITLFPDGRYGEQYESSYSGNLSGGGNWGTAGQNDRGGRWTVKGSKEQGQIIVRLNNGNELIYNYRVHSKNGQTYYTEYFFNGDLYGKSRID